MNKIKSKVKNYLSDDSLVLQLLLQLRLILDILHGTSLKVNLTILRIFQIEVIQGKVKNLRVAIHLVVEETKSCRISKKNAKTIFLTTQL